MTTSSRRDAGPGPQPGHGEEPRPGGAGSPSGGEPSRVIGGRYRLAEQIGRGAMGTVWRARDELLDRDVAVKEVRLPPSGSEEERAGSYQRTLREARTAARLSHPGVAAVYDVVEELGRPWIVMELVNGRSLDRVIAEDGPLSPAVAARLGRQVLAALATAHTAGVLHRDVKPSNVIVAAGGRVVLTDFGIATAEGDPSLTQTGMVMGSPGFLAPERIRGATATPASDLWSLGATLYAAVEGKGPYDRHGGAITTMAAVVTEEPPPPKSCGPLTPLVRALLSRDPAERPTVTAAAQMLDAVDGGSDAGRGQGDDVPDGGSALGGGAAEVDGETVGASAHGAVVPHGSIAPPGPMARGTLPLAQTLQPSAVLPPGSSPRHPRDLAGAPAGLGAPPPAPMAPVAMYTPTAPADTPMRPAPMGAAPAAPTSINPASMGPASMGPASMGPAGPPATGSTPGGTTYPRYGPNRSPRRHHIVTFVIIGAAIFLVAAAAAAAIHRARSATAGPSSQRTGAGRGGGGAHSHTGSRGPVRQRARSLPPGFRWYSQPPGAAGSGSKGFSVAVPKGWRVKRIGERTEISEPGGARFLELDLTPHKYQVMMAELLWLQRTTRAQGTFPGYQLRYILPVRYQGARAADWSFIWRNRASGLTGVRDRVWIARGPARGQSFAIYWSTPLPEWVASQPLLEEALSTFRPVG
ncbi:MAG: serine/threonine-protein kinase [Micromonosporaceae bacterium]